MRRLSLLPLLLCVSGCVGFSGAQQAQISDARSLAARALEDPRFEAVMLALDDDSKIVWEGKLDSDLPDHPDDPTRWLINEYERHGPPVAGDIQAWVPYVGFGVFSKATAQAGYGGPIDLIEETSG